MPRVKKEENLEKPKDADISKNFLSSLLNGYKDSHYNFIQCEPKHISSGSLLLDSCIFIKSGSVIRIGGAQAESGKSSQCVLLAKNYMQTMPKSKTLLINTEARLSEEFKKRMDITFIDTPEAWDYGTIFVLYSNVMETACQMIESMLRTMYEQGEHLCVIIDCLDLMVLNSTLTEKKLGDQPKTAGVQFLTKELFRRIALPIHKYNALLLITSQYSASINLNPYASHEPPKLMEGSAANALNHQCEYALFYRPRYNKDLILEKPDEKPDPFKNRILGSYATVEIKKSATEQTGHTIRIPIKRGQIGNAVWMSKEIVDLCMYWNLCSKNKAWISFDKEIFKQLKEINPDTPEQIQGLDALHDFIDSNQNVKNWLYEKIKSILTNFHENKVY